MILDEGLYSLIWIVYPMILKGCEMVTIEADRLEELAD